MAPFTRLLCWEMALAGMGAGASGCSGKAFARTTDLMEGRAVTAGDVYHMEAEAEVASALGDFGPRLARACDDGEKNLLVSPLSVAFALALAANGAQGSTLAQIKEVLGASVDVLTCMPRLSYDWDADITKALQGLGIVDAFDLFGQTADFTAMATVKEGEHLHIDYVVHKTHIDVDEKGTRAAAATAVTMELTSAAPSEEEEPHEVYLTRPFVFAIMGLETGVPAFIGIVRDPTT